MSAKDSAEYWVDQLSGRIDACDSCQPCDGGEVVWTAGDPQSVQEFLEESGVPEELLDEVATELYCSCGNDLQLDSEIVADSIATQLDEEAGDRFGIWVVEDNPRFQGFRDYLKDNAKDGRSHELGREILDQLQALKPTNVSGVWWRARSIDMAKAEPRSGELGPPPSPPKTGGRFNPSGQRAFYLGSDRDAAASEAGKYRKDNSRIWAQRFNVSALDKVVNLVAPLSPRSAFSSSDLPSLFAGLLWCNGLVQQRPADEQSLEYLLPQYIAECAASLGIRGITYNSLLHSGTNLVLYDWSDGDVVAIGNPEAVD